MSTSGISGSGFSQLDSLLASMEQFNTDFKQLGSDLKSGNLSAAQEDFVTLSQDVLSSPLAQASNSSSPAAATAAATAAASTTASTSTTSGTSSSSATTATGSSTQSALSALAQDFQTLGQDLQSGNLS